MSQPSVERYFRARKRRAEDDLPGKTKISRGETDRFVKKCEEVLSRERPESPAPTAETSESKNVPFEKMGTLSPKKRATPAREPKTPQKVEEEASSVGAVTPKKNRSMGHAIKAMGSMSSMQKSQRLSSIKASIDKWNEKMENATGDGNRALKSEEKTKEIEFEIPAR